MNKKNTLLSTFLAFFLPLVSFAENNSLCQNDEQILFTCLTKNNKTISVCASKNLSATSGYMQYRFGQKDNIEMSYPSSKVPANKAFTGRAQMFSGGGGTYLRFNKNDYDYILYTGIGKGWEVNGLIVLKDANFVSYFSCNHQPVSQITPQELEDLKIPLDPDNREFFPGDIPSVNKRASRGGVNLNSNSNEALERIKACYDKVASPAELRTCANNEYTFYDNMLNKRYNTLLGLLSQTKQNLLIDTQKAWLVYRKKECDFESLQNEEGTLQPLSLLECYTSLNKKRIAQLNDFIKLYQN
ncbi:lysozyme inhibitor LprI family protein [Legionella cardiaca]|uniref:Lysozyme inhibitor LprI family protein n=1 Tax=Legionella cardiaca TaxID=1071983 RepID=A0ABY8AY91_9GAMM|nr:lysozyme inhibitor LprI family protein [Legionella cardiaca]WED44470.1 lysozyme inhibitor LprI family protein [Legionella cardiaca]